MMKLKTWALFAALFAASAQAQAGGSIRAGVGGGGFDLEQDQAPDIEADLSSLDFRGHVDITDHVFLRGQYTGYSADEIEVDGRGLDADVEINTLRFAVGYGADVGAVRLYGAAEYIKIDLELQGDSGDESGAGITFGASDRGKSKLLWSAEIARLRVDDTSGIHIEAAIGYRLSQVFAVLGGMQRYIFTEDEEQTGFGSAYVALQLSF